MTKKQITQDGCTYLIEKDKKKKGRAIVVFFKDPIKEELNSFDNMTEFRKELKDAHKRLIKMRKRSERK
jgi:hypothetical protein